MTTSIKRLAPGDEAVLGFLATEDADFDLDERGAALEPLDEDAARRFLANPAVVLWVAVDDAKVVAFLYCVVVPLRSGTGQELLLYEIGVRRAWRRRGTGRALLAHMDEWMKTNAIDVVWVGADNEGAVAFYRECGFTAEEPQPVYMTRET